MVLGNIEVERKKRIFDTEGNVTTESIDVSWELVRAYRDAYLSKSDLWVLLDRYNTLTDSQKTELTTYRQALRDITKQTPADDSLSNITWPTKPE